VVAGLLSNLRWRVISNIYIFEWNKRFAFLLIFATQIIRDGVTKQLWISFV